ncbi:MAG: OmpA family protein [Parasphingorhabdus sp.]|jgi:outer membrane protein OmpA-like peptidoglycan-associated protein|nr:OmpA family protein [Parasphingorhabdus sp.]|tara:strand:+ start:247 stop:927 length:681 start_codon:yes stop_codon:yes gene_type:complete
MRMNKIMVAAASLSALALTSGCVTDPETGNRTISKAAIGGLGGVVGGYLLGDVLGGRNDRTAKIVGAGLGGLAGAGIGYYMDEQEKKLRQQTAGTGIDVTREGDNLILNMPSNVTFPVDSSAIQPSFQTTLSNVANTLAQYEKSYVDVLGHTDSTGSDAYNQALSERRAEAVANFLANSGVQRARLATKGYGESQPIASNATEEGRAANRRVEIKIVPITEDDLNN